MTDNLCSPPVFIWFNNFFFYNLIEKNVFHLSTFVSVTVIWNHILNSETVWSWNYWLVQELTFRTERICFKKFRSLLIKIKSRKINVFFFFFLLFSIKKVYYCNLFGVKIQEPFCPMNTVKDAQIKASSFCPIVTQNCQTIGSLKVKICKFIYIFVIHKLYWWLTCSILKKKQYWKCLFSWPASSNRPWYK